MVSLHVKRWDETKAWSSFTGYHPKDLARRLTSLTGQRRDRVKGWVRQLKRRECITLPLRQGRGRTAGLFAPESARVGGSGRGGHEWLTSVLEARVGLRLHRATRDNMNRDHTAFFNPKAAGTARSRQP
jgi:hypothetical protein